MEDYQDSQVEADVLFCEMVDSLPVDDDTKSRLVKLYVKKGKWEIAFMKMIPKTGSRRRGYF